MGEFNEKMLSAKEKLLARFKRERPPLATADRQDRLPPGQHLTHGFPILDLGIRPSIDFGTWTLEITGDVERPMAWNWDEFKQLPKVDQVSDFHCVTTWSKFDVHWGGVKFQSIAELVMPRPTTRYVILGCGEGYTTNLSIDEAMDDDVLLAYELDGRPIPLEHGGPMRLIVPKLYAWKSAKFLRQIRFAQYDEPGFWEIRGYHNHGDPWLEERYG